MVIELVCGSCFVSQILLGLLEKMFVLQPLGIPFKWVGTSNTMEEYWTTIDPGCTAWGIKDVFFASTSSGNIMELDSSGLDGLQAIQSSSSVLGSGGVTKYPHACMILHVLIWSQS